MLFGYPLEATSENWLHDCLIEIFQITHESIKNGQDVPAWPQIIPEEYRSRLRRRISLRRHFEAYKIVAKTLTYEELERISTALIYQNNIAELLVVCQN